MGNLVNALSLYQIINNLMPGVITAIFCSWYFGITSEITSVSDAILAGFVCYFVGMTLSRIGSLVIEPVVLKLHLVKKSKNFYKAEKKDEKIGLLLTERNCYRTISATALVLIIIITIHRVAGYGDCNRYTVTIAALILILIIYIMAFIKQAGHIYQRAEANK